VVRRAQARRTSRSSGPARATNARSASRGPGRDELWRGPGRIRRPCERSARRAWASRWAQTPAEYYRLTFSQTRGLMASKPSAPNRATDSFVNTLRHNRAGLLDPGVPELEKMVRNNQGGLLTDMKSAWWGSDPYAQPDQRREMGRFVRRNYKGDVWTEPFSAPGKRGEREILPDGRETIKAKILDTVDWLMGNQTIATMHTHPFHQNSPPNDFDRANARQTDTSGIVVGHEGQYYYGRPALPPQPTAPGWQFWK